DTPGTYTPSSQQPSLLVTTRTGKRDTRKGGAAFPPRPESRGLHDANMMTEVPVPPQGGPGGMGPPGKQGAGGAPRTPEDVRRALAEQIGSGRLRPGQRLGAERALAGQVPGRPATARAAPPRP